MKLTPLGRALCEEIAQMSIIDAHTHLPAEKDYLAFGYSGLNMFAGYIWHDLESAGLSSEFKATMREGGRRPADEWWPKIRPHWQMVRHTSFARALLITARDLFGTAEISDRTIGLFAEKVIADNTPGLYRRILQERCRIRYSITCIDRADFPDDPGLRGITTLFKCAIERDGLAKLAQRSGRAVNSLEEAGAALQSLLRADLERGAVGFKMTIHDIGAPDTSQAQGQFKEAQRSSEPPTSFPSLRDYLFDKALDVAAQADVPVAVHSGYWGDFRRLDPKFMLAIAPRRPDVRFDLFHLGMPFVRDAALIGKNLPNVTLNLTWCPIISQVQTARVLDEILDLVPLNKLIAFGADYRVCVQKAWGHLALAREAVAAALAKRIEAGEMDRDRALHIARLWFHDNPARIYRLPA